MKCKECNTEMYSERGISLHIFKIVCPKCKKVIQGTHTAKSGVLLQDIKLKELEIEL